MRDDETPEPPEDPGSQEPEPAPEPAYPPLEFDKLSESDHGERGGWRSLDDE
jgi:hypothetical protein